MKAPEMAECKHRKILRFFFSSFQKVPEHLMYDGLFHFGHLLSLPSSTFQGGFFFLSSFFFSLRVQN